MGSGLLRWRARMLGGYLGDLVAALLLLLSHASRRLFGIRGSGGVGGTGRCWRCGTSPIRAWASRFARRPGP
jgi:hypothetical protein